MIYYFTATGNSGYVAEQLGRELEEVTFFMNSSAPGVFEGESLGFVFPVYSWGVPPNIGKFILSLPESLRHQIEVGQIYVWVVMTCGDEVAMAPEMITRILGKIGLKPASIWSVIMPNNYVILPGFDVDPADVEKNKLTDAPSRIMEIAGGLRMKRKCVDVTRGGMPRLKSSLVYPLFKRWGIFTSKWHSTDACISCGICVRSCPQDNVVLNESGRPVWGKNCCSCLACYHSCPSHAVQYGKETRKKGQYLFSRAIKTLLNSK